MNHISKDTCLLLFGIAAFAAILGKLAYDATPPDVQIHSAHFCITERGDVIYRNGASFYTWGCIKPPPNGPLDFWSEYAMFDWINRRNKYEAESGEHSTSIGYRAFSEMEATK